MKHLTKEQSLLKMQFKTKMRYKLSNLKRFNDGPWILDPDFDDSNVEILSDKEYQEVMEKYSKNNK